MPHRVIGQPVLLAPGRRVAVQLRHPAGLFGLQAGAEQVGEQVVVAPPAADLIQRHQEQSRPLHLLQQRLAARAAGHRVTQRAGQPLQHRGLQQERAHLLALPLEHLLGQVVQHVAVAAGERRHEPGHIVLPAQRQAGQLQPRRPPFGPFRQRRHGRIGQGQAGPAATCRSSAAASPGVNRSSAARTSASWPRARSRASASGGSLRLASTTQIPAGRCSSKNPSESCTGWEPITW